jgi:hypothetical protein
MLLPDQVDDYVTEENPVCAMDAFVDALDLAALGFEGVTPERTGRTPDGQARLPTARAAEDLHLQLPEPHPVDDGQARDNVPGDDSWCAGAERWRSGITPDRPGAGLPHAMPEGSFSGTKSCGRSWIIAVKAARSAA